MTQKWLICALLASPGLGGCAVAVGDEAQAVEAEDVGEHTNALVGNQYVTKETTYGVGAAREVVVDCPAGTYVYGAGFRTAYENGTSTDATLRHFAPSADGRSFRIKVRKPQGLTVWKLVGTAACAPKVVGYQIKVTESALEHGHQVIQKSDCGPAGREPPFRPMGGGYGLFDASGNVLESSVRAMQPSAVGWSATMHNPSGGPATAKTFAVCVPSSSVQEYDFVATSKAWPTGSYGPVTILSSCAAGGLALSGGFQVLDQFGNEMFGIVTESRNANLLGSSGWRATVSRSTTPSKQLPTTLKQFLMCVKDQPG